MATASTFDEALLDVLDALAAATRALEGSREPMDVAQKAADLALRLTGSVYAVVALASDQLFDAGSKDRPRGGAIESLELRAQGQELGTLTVGRFEQYTYQERVALELFAAHVALALVVAGSRVGGAQETIAVLEDLRKSVDRLTKVDGARQLLLKSMNTAVERERKRFVSELHDDALQTLTAAELEVTRLAMSGKVGASLEKLQSLLEQTESAVRRLIFEARPPSLDNPDGLAQSIRDRVAMLAVPDLEAELDLDLPTEIAPEVRTVVFRQLAEAIGNVERHSAATQVKISVKTDDGGLLGVVRDNGRGFDVAARSNLPGHLGLLALRERALMSGGRYKIESRPGAGTHVEFWIPLAQ